jgi:Cdc6-like AAA superfamily ATPase
MTSMNTKIVETKMVKEIISRTLDCHTYGGGGAVWYGKAGIGKTTTTRHLTDKVNQHAASGEPSSFRAVHYHVGEISAISGNAMKQAIKSLYQAALGRTLDTGVYRSSLPEELAIMLARELQANKIEMIFIDDADVLSPNAIRGMMLVIKIAEDMGWRLSLVFIGDELLLLSFHKVPPIFRRISEWCYFGEYGLEETWEILAELHPHFRSLDRHNEGHINQIKFIYEMIGGFPGPLVRFIQRMDFYSKRCGGVINENFLRTMCYLSQQDLEKSLKDLRRSAARRG